MDYENIDELGKFSKAAGDSSGTLAEDATTLADHLAIRNLVSAYGHLLDDGHYEAYLDMFTNDVCFQITSPGWGKVSYQGREFIEDFIDQRIRPNTAVKARHIQGMIHVAEQNTDTAEVRAQALLRFTTVDGKRLDDLATTASYNFSLVKSDNRWRISRMYIEVDASNDYGPPLAGKSADAHTRVFWSPDN